MTPLGSRLQIAAWTVRGNLNEAAWRRLLLAVVDALKMCPAYEPMTYDYPLDGKGGVGFTVIQPITESFVVVDTWPNHGGAYLVVASCKPFRRSAAVRVLRAAGLHVDRESVEAGLALVRTRRA